MSYKGPKKGPNTARGKYNNAPPKRKATSTPPIGGAAIPTPVRGAAPQSYTSNKIVLPSEGQMLGTALRLLGGDHIEVRCADDKIRMIRIPGKIRRRMWVKIGDVVVIEPWYGLQDDTKGDLKYRYRKTDLRALSKNKRCQEALIKLEVSVPKETSEYGNENINIEAYP